MHQVAAIINPGQGISCDQILEFASHGLKVSVEFLNFSGCRGGFNLCVVVKNNDVMGRP